MDGLLQLPLVFFICSFELCLACMFVSILAVGFELVKYARIYVDLRMKSDKETALNTEESGTELAKCCETPDNMLILPIDVKKSSRTYCGCFLYILQMAFSYTLMLAAMTYNFYILLCLLLGGGASMFYWEHPSRKLPNVLKKMLSQKSKQIKGGTSCH